MGTVTHTLTPPDQIVSPVFLQVSTYLNQLLQLFTISCNTNTVIITYSGGFIVLLLLSFALSIFHVYIHVLCIYVGMNTLYSSEVERPRVH